MFKRWFLAGLLIWLPIMATFFVINLLVSTLDKVIDWLPARYHTEALIGIPLPGLGVIISILVILTTGIIATNFLGNKLVQSVEKIVQRIPIVRTIYSGTKQVMETLLSSQSEAFRKVLLVEYPREGLWTLAFQTGSSTSSIGTTDTAMLTVFIPTTPNPTSGFLLIVPKKDVVELTITVEEALKFVVSLGTVNGTGIIQSSAEFIQKYYK